MRIRDFLARFKELNKYLEEFPPFNGAAQVLPEDEIILILESAIPNKWQQQMVLQGFEVVDKTIQEFIEFCERLEFSEQVYDSTHTGQKANVKNDNKTTSGSKASAGSSNKKRKTDYFCLYHGHNTSHNTDDCKVLKAQAEKMAASHSRVGAGKYKNRTSHDYKNDSKKKLESFKTEIVRDVVDSLTKMRSRKVPVG